LYLNTKKKKKQSGTHVFLSSLLELTLLRRSERNFLDRLGHGAMGGVGFFHNGFGHHEGGLWFCVVRMHRSEVIGVCASEHLYLFLELILVFRVKVFVHGLNLKREEVMLKIDGSNARSNIYDRQSEFSLENNVLKTVFVVAGIKSSIYHRV
jgi:hypothetical protein